MRTLRKTRHNQWWITLGAALALIGTSGCKDDPATVEARDLASEELDARCEFLVRCGHSPNQAICLASNEVDTDLVQAVGGVTLGITRYDDEAASTYISALREHTCDGDLASARELEAARAAMFSGTLAPGADCFADPECQGDAVCDRNACDGSLCCFGQCVAYEVIAIGQACPLIQDGPYITSGCGDDAYCSAPPQDEGAEPPATGTCAPRVDNGLSCSVHEQCFDGQRCDLSDSGTCYILSAAGEPCSPTLATGGCAGLDLMCDPGTSTCSQLPGPGQACSFGRCQGLAQCREEMCVARPAEGESCEDTPPCLGDMRCADGICSTDQVVLVCVEGQPPPEPEPV